MAGGFFGRILFVNLKTQTWRVETPDEQLYRDYIGGFGLGSRILFEHMKPGADPLGPENLLGFMAGLLVGTKAHITGRFSVVAKSPLTGGWGDANCGGRFGPHLKAAGYDAVFFEEISPVPVYVSLYDDEVTFHDASQLWGLTSSASEKKIREALGREYSVCTIGQAGEHKSAIAGIFNDLGRAAARTGLGGVMGSKQLKGLAAGGTHKPSVVNGEAFQGCLEWMKSEALEKRAPGFRKFGTTGAFPNNVNLQDAPFKNWKEAKEGFYTTEQALKLAAPEFVPYTKRKYACAQCTVGCGAIMEIEDADGNLCETHRPEYETIATFGSLCLSDSVADVIAANDACNNLGFDTISAGGTIAWLLECADSGLLTEEQKEGLDLSWGNSAIFVPLLKKMAYREGFLGNLLADGSRAAAAKLGKGSEFLVDIGGVEPPMHDPRCLPGYGPGYTLNPKPGHHCQAPLGQMQSGWSDKELNAVYDYSWMAAEKYNFEKDLGLAQKHLSSWFNFFDAVGMCVLAKYVGYPNYRLVETVRAVTGWDYTLEEALQAGARMNTLRHLFNLREGLNHTDFALKNRLAGIPPLKSGPTANITVTVEPVRLAYFKEMDWDPETDMPSDQALNGLGLQQLVQAHMK